MSNLITSPNGPHPRTREERWQLVHTLAERARAKHGDDLLAVGVYGSLARETDGPYSDTEMMCVLRGEGIDYSADWTTGPWKAEVNFFSADVVRAGAAELEEDWSLTQGVFAFMHPLYDPAQFFATLPPLVFGHSQAEFNTIMKLHIVGEVYEAMGKLRNAQHNSYPAFMPRLAFMLAGYGANLIGLLHRRLYTSAAAMLDEALAMPNVPEGYNHLCQLVQRGELHNPDQTHQTCESFWQGLLTWAAQHGIDWVSETNPF